jgi:hypothetical protein
VTYGYPSEKILEFAEHRVDLILMDIAGLSGFSKLKALRNVTRNVSRRRQTAS